MNETIDILHYGALWLLSSCSSPIIDDELDIELEGVAISVVLVSSLTNLIVRAFLLIAVPIVSEGEVLFYGRRVYIYLRMLM